MENPPLFQQVDGARVGVGGAQRDAFLAWVEANAADLDARRVLLPDAFRGPVVWVSQGFPWVKLDLGGVSQPVLDAHPDLRRHVEIVGCAACHATDAPFVQVSAERVPSPFYVKELAARAQFLGRMSIHQWERAPYGPLQENPVLPR